MKLHYAIDFFIFYIHIHYTYYILYVIVNFDGRAENSGMSSQEGKQI